MHTRVRQIMDLFDFGEAGGAPGGRQSNTDPISQPLSIFCAAVKILGCYLSGSSRAVRLFCLLTNIPHEWREGLLQIFLQIIIFFAVDVSSGENYSASFLALNPRHNVEFSSKNFF